MVCVRFRSVSGGRIHAFKGIPEPSIDGTAHCTNGIRHDFDVMDRMRQELAIPAHEDSDIRFMRIFKPEPAERAIFDALYKRLKQARDGLLAHDDGSAQGMEHYGNFSSFRPQDAGVAPEDVGRLLICAERLLAAVKSMCALPPPC